jgi:hypothetical protein
MYSEDFSAAEAAYAPVSNGLFLGVSPLLLLLLLMLVAAAGLLGWWLGRGGSGGSSAEEAAPGEIHQAILKASAAAMAASSNDLKGKAQVLRDRIVDLLGPVLDVAKGLTPGLKALDEALKGEKKVEAKPEAARPAKPPAAPACACGKPDACTCPKPATGPVTVNQVYIGGAPVAASASCGCQGAHKPDCAHPTASPEPKPSLKPETQPMTGPEQTEALARAVRQFHDHWLDGPARIRELKAARAALSRRPPASAVKPHGSHH